MSVASKTIAMAVEGVQYETTLSRAALAIVAGAGSGALLVSAFVMATEFGEPVPTFIAGIEGASSIFGFAFAAWIVGLVILAPIPWLTLHRRHRRTWRVAAALGASLASIVGLVISAAILMDFGEIIQGQMALKDILSTIGIGCLFGIAGAIVGVIVWRVAYRQSGPF